MTKTPPPAGGALVTGAGRGLGAEIARALDRRGYAVHVTDVDEPSARLVAEALDDGAWASRLDVRDAQACRAAAAATVERAGSLAVWVNNAGLIAAGPGWTHDEAERDRLFAVNVHGTMNGTAAALEIMRATGRGHIVNIVSLAGLVAVPGLSLYAATKHACLGFTLGMMHDLRQAGERDIHVSAICPDGIWTPMLEPHLADDFAALSWSGRMLSTDVVARTVLAVLDRPRPFVAIPRWRGVAARTAAALPRVARAVSPIVVADARRRQRAFRRRLADRG